MRQSSRQFRLSGAIVFIASIAIVVAAAFLQLARGHIYFFNFAQDIFIPLGGVAHMQAGELPHLGFSTPIGFFYYLFHDATLLFAPLSGRTLIYANLIVGLIAVVLTVPLMLQRLPPLMAGLAGVYIGMLAVSPRQLGGAFTYVSYNATYNRYSWTFVCILALVAALKPRANPRYGAIVDGIMTGLLLFVLFYLKITVFLVGGVIVAAAALLVRRSRFLPFAVAAAVAFVVGAALLELRYGITAAYISDLRAVAAAQSDAFRAGQFRNIANYAYGGAVLVVVLGLLNRDVGQRRSQQAIPILLALIIVAGGVLIGTQNFSAFENPLIPVAAIVAWFGARDFIAPPAGLAGAARARPPLDAVQSLAGLVGIVGLFLLPLGQDLLSSAWTAVAPVSRDPGLAWLQATPVGDVRLAPKPNRLLDPAFKVDDPASFILDDVEYASILADGMAVLSKHTAGQANPVVLSLTWDNPFPILLRLPPAPHDLAWWDAGRSFSERSKPPGGPLFDKVDFVMIPKLYYNYESTELMLSAYRDQLSKFKQVDASRFWTVLQRQ